MGIAYIYIYIYMYRKNDHMDIDNRGHPIVLVRTRQSINE